MSNSIFHLLNRGVEKRKIFLSVKDYIRFMDNIFDFNDRDNAFQSYHVRRNSKEDLNKEKLVNVLCLCLMPNHPHILVLEREEGFVSEFSRKIFGGYTMYFNEQNTRNGVLFQGRTKIIKVIKDEHFLHLPFYIHSNPLSLYQKDWKEKGIIDIEGALRFLEEYRWSNYGDIIGVSNGEFSKITDKNKFFDIFDTNKKQYKKDFERWLKERIYIIN